MFDFMTEQRHRDYADDLAAYADDDPIVFRADGFRNRVENTDSGFMLTPGAPWGYGASDNTPKEG